MTRVGEDVRARAPSVPDAAEFAAAHEMATGDPAMRSRTVFLITHRPSSRGTCGLWRPLEHGRLVRRGAPTTTPS